MFHIIGYKNSSNRNRKKSTRIDPDPKRTDSNKYGPEIIERNFTSIYWDQVYRTQKVKTTQKIKA